MGEINPLLILEREQEVVERELIELETIIDEDIINYGNLIHVFKKFHNFWNDHEEKESKVFEVLKQAGYFMEISKMDLDCSDLKAHKDNLVSGLGSGSEYILKQVLESDGREIIRKVRGQMENETWAFCMVDWESLDRDFLETIQLIQVLPVKTKVSDLLNDKLLRENILKATTFK